MCICLNFVQGAKKTTQVFTFRKCMRKVQSIATLLATKKIYDRNFRKVELA